MTAFARRTTDRIAFLVNGGPGSAMADRARTFAEGIASSFECTLHFREGGRVGAAAAYFRSLRETHPSAVYVLDLTAPAVAAAYAFRRLSGCRVIVDTGDATAALIGASRRVGRVGFAALDRYERQALLAADALIVRGTYHRQYLAERGVPVAAVIPDGVHMTVFQPGDAGALRSTLGLSGRLVVGVVGSLYWNKRLQWTPGMELIDALATAASDRVIGLIIGQGSGLDHLRARARRSGVSDRVCFIDRWLDLPSLAAHVNALDVCLSTQTNNLVGRVRTSGKLPLFLAAGRFVVATRVGEAARLLPEEMLLEYDADFDPGYPLRLAERLERIVRTPDLLASAGANRAIAEAEFDYRLLVPRVRRVLEQALDCAHAA